MPKVSVRVVGNYFGSKSSATGVVTVDVPEPSPNVYNVMVAVSKAARAGKVPAVNAFAFDPPNPGPNDMLNAIAVRFTAAPKQKLEPGVYFLQEVKVGNPEYVFQYYIYDKDRKQLNFDSSFHPFNSPPPVPILDGYTIIWRLVGILSRPNYSRRVESELDKDSDHLEKV